MHTEQPPGTLAVVLARSGPRPGLHSCLRPASSPRSATAQILVLSAPLGLSTPLDVAQKALPRVIEQPLKNVIVRGTALTHPAA
eukprot:12505896-Alexandrium_andersonii.AAC.1